MYEARRGNTDRKEAFTMKNEQDRHRIEFTVRDRLLRAWENSMEMARDFEGYSHEYNANSEYSRAFAKYAVDEARHAAELKDMLHEYQSKQ